MSALAEKRTELEAKRSQLATIFDEIKEGKKIADADVKTEIKRRNDELDALVSEVTSLRELDDIERKTREALKDQRTPAADQPMHHPTQGDGQLVGPDGQPLGKARELTSLGRAFTQTEEYKSLVRGKNNPRAVVELADVSMTAQFKATITTTAGFAPFAQRSNLVVPYAVRRVMVPDIIPSDDTQQPAIIYMEQTTFTNAADVVAEGGTKPEGATVWTQRTVPLEVIAEWVPVTRQQLDDVPQAEALINDFLTLGVKLTEEYQLLNGNGTSPQLQGFYNKTGVQVQAKGADPVPSAIRKGITLIQAIGFADPTAVVMHPNDVQDMMLLQDTVGNYIFGGPGAPAPERVWGLPIVNTTAATENTALLGDFTMYAHIWRRQGITIDVSDSHSDYFVKNLLAIRAEERVALTVLRPAAFCRVTGI